MTVRKVMIIRHGEKPPKSGPPPYGVDLAGVHSEDQLTPLGLQRAGALVTLFAPLDGRSLRPPLERPAAVFAAGASASSTSLRPQSTVGPLVSALGSHVPFRVLPAPVNEPMLRPIFCAQEATSPWSAGSTSVSGTWSPHSHGARSKPRIGMAAGSTSCSF